MAGCRGTVVLNADGSFTYTPNAGFEGLDTFTYWVTDGTDTSSGLVTIDVVNLAPVASGDTYDAQQNGSLYVVAAGVLTNDTDANGDALTAVKVTDPAHGTVTLSPDGAFTYVPATDYVGADSFTYKANDGLSDSAPVTVTITVLPTVAPSTTKLGAVYRFYNSASGTHFYTFSPEERDAVLLNYQGILSYEGIAFYADPASNTAPLYRFYNPWNHSHFYTVSAEEKARIQALWPYQYTYEGVAFMVSDAAGPGKTPVYRFYNLRNGAHFFTASLEEANWVIATWSDVYVLEGTAFWVDQ